MQQQIEKEMIVKFIYRAKEGAPFSQGKAQEVGEYLEEIRGKNEGKLTALNVVKAARSINSPLHPYFDWNESSAAGKWLVHQARLLINHVEVVYECEEIVEHYPAYINIKRTNEDENVDADRAYMDYVSVGNSEFMRKQALQDALKQLTHWKRKYGWLSEMDKIVEKISELEIEYRR